MAASSISLTLLRPGAVSGPYPERVITSDSLATQLARILKSYARSVRNTRKRTRFLTAVEAQGYAFRTMSDACLQAEVTELRSALGKSGLTPALVEQAFALIREAAQRTLNLRPHDVQLLGAREILAGRLAEMATGEGKTLVASLPAAAAGLAGIPVHIVTVNDYLAERDCDRLRADAELVRRRDPPGGADELLRPHGGRRTPSRGRARRRPRADQGHGLTEAISADMADPGRGASTGRDPKSGSESSSGCCGC